MQEISTDFFRKQNARNTSLPKLQHIQKIIIIGCPGAGKSTLATKLTKHFNYPLYHLDKIF